MAYSGVMKFRETSVFTRQITRLLPDDEYKELQKVLIRNPAAGAVIPKSGGLRKIRWRSPEKGKGKRGGIRVIYYWFVTDDEIYMLLAYGKDEKDDLTAGELNVVRGLIEEMER
jgi:mRNA-degrading endonuclease RelE of RelBE toxin-antitoxin system